MPLTDYAPHELQPRHLSPEEACKPSLVTDELFRHFYLPQVREVLWQWFSVTVAGNYNKALTRSQRQDIVTLYEQLVKLVEAAHIQHRQNWGKAEKPVQGRQPNK